MGFSQLSSVALFPAFLVFVDFFVLFFLFFRQSPSLYLTSIFTFCFCFLCFTSSSSGYSFLFSLFNFLVLFTSTFLCHFLFFFSLNHLFNSSLVIFFFFFLSFGLLCFRYSKVRSTLSFQSKSIQVEEAKHCPLVAYILAENMLSKP